MLTITAKLKLRVGAKNRKIAETMTLLNSGLETSTPRLLALVSSAEVPDLLAVLLNIHLNYSKFMELDI